LDVSAVPFPNDFGFNEKNNRRSWQSSSYELVVEQGYVNYRVSEDGLNVQPTKF
jgi:hypothetical protein